MDYPKPEDNGWLLMDDDHVPLWLSCSQFLPRLCRKHIKKAEDIYAEEADVESSDRERNKQLEPPKSNIRIPRHPMKLINICCRYFFLFVKE